MSERRTPDGQLIVTSFVYPPIPIRCFDWSAVTENYDGAPRRPDEHHRGVTAMPDGRIIPRNSVTVRKLGAELNRAVEIKRALQEHDDPQLILDMIEGETDLAEACLVVLEETMEDETLLAGVKATIDLMQARKSRLERSIDNRRNVILMAMEKAGLQTIKGVLATLAVRETQPKAIVSDEALIPAKFWKPSDPKLDKAALKEALEAKEEVPGASLSNGGVTLSIRVK